MTFPDTPQDLALVFNLNIPYQYDAQTQVWTKLEGNDGEIVTDGRKVYVWHHGNLIEYVTSNFDLNVSVLLRSIDFMIKDWALTGHGMTANEVAVLKAYQRLTV
jgi:phenylalanyl-tRNA synthetase beta subunit